MQKNLIIILVLSIFISLFAILNAGPVPINLFFTTLEISVALVILISATIGAVIVFFLDTASKYKYRKEIKESQKYAEKMENEKAELEEKNRWYETELARLREQNLEQILENGSNKKSVHDESEKPQAEKGDPADGKSQGLKDRWNDRKSQKKGLEDRRDKSDESKDSKEPKRNDGEDKLK